MARRIPTSPACGGFLLPARLNSSRAADASAGDGATLFEARNSRQDQQESEAPGPTMRRRWVQGFTRGKGNRAHSTNRRRRLRVPSNAGIELSAWRGRRSYSALLRRGLTNEALPQTDEAGGRVGG